MCAFAVHALYLHMFQGHKAPFYGQSRTFFALKSVAFLLRKDKI